MVGHNLRGLNLLLPGDDACISDWRCDLLQRYALCVFLVTLIVAGYGLLPSLSKLYNNSSYSNLGLVVHGPNPFTGLKEFYIVELTRNLIGQNDALLHHPKFGVCVFPMYERIHRHHGADIHLLPLKQPLSDDQQAKLLAFVASFHQSTGDYYSALSTAALPPSLDVFLSSKTAYSVGKFAVEVMELFGSHFVLQALHVAGCGPAPPPVGVVSPLQLLARNLHDTPIQLRSVFL